jgi:importin-5
MSINVPDEKLQQLDAKLGALLGGDNDARREASKFIQRQFKHNLPEVAYALAVLLRRGSTPNTRNQCAVFLRTQLMRGEPLVYSKISVELQTHVKGSLLDAILHESTLFLKKQFAETAIEIAGYELHRQGSNGWPEFLPFLARCGNADDMFLRRLSLITFGRLYDDAPDILNPFIGKIGPILLAGLEHQNMDVKVDAVIAILKTTGGVDDNDAYDKFQATLPVMMKVMHRCLEAKQYEKLRKVLQNIGELARIAAIFFEPHIDELSRLIAMIGCTKEHYLEDRVRRSCVEFFSFCTVDAAPMCRRHKVLIKSAIDVCFSLMLDVEDDPNWITTPEPLTYARTGSDNFSTGERGIDLIGGNIKHKKFLPVVMPVIMDFVKRDDWKFRHAGIMCFSQMVEMFLLDDLPVNQMIEFTRDPHPRVRYAAAHCLGQMAVDFCEEGFQQKYHAEMFNTIMPMLMDKRFPRVQKHAAAALFNFVDGAMEEDVSPYVDRLIPSLVDVVQHSHRLAGEQTLTLVAAISGIAKAEFKKHARSMVNMCKHVIKTANKKEDAMLRARAMECVTFIGLSLEKGSFRNDARELMDMFINIMKSNVLEDDDISVQYLLSAWSRICTVLGKDFVPYLQLVMPHVFRLAGTKCKIAYDYDSDADEEELQLRTSEMNASIEDKANGLSMLTSFLHDLGGDFFPHLFQAKEICVPLLEYYFNDEVRAFAISAAPDMVKCAVEACKADKVSIDVVIDLFEEITDKIINCFKSECDMEIMMTLVAAFKEMVALMGPMANRIMSPITLDSVGQAMARLLKTSAGRVKNRETQKKAREMDEELMAEIEGKNQSEKELNYTVSECIGAVVRAVKGRFIPVFKNLWPDIKKMLEPPHPTHAISTALFIIDDVVEICGADAADMYPVFMPILVRFLKHPRPEPKQAAAYGLGIGATAGKQAFQPVVQTAIEALFHQIRNPSIEFETKIPQSEVRDYVDQFVDNCISAVGRIIMSQPVGFDRSKAIPEWLEHLPLKYDKDEATNVYECLCALVEKKSPELLGQNLANLPKIVRVLVHIAGTDWVRTHEMNERVLAILRSLPVDKLKSIASSLPGDQADKLRLICTTGTTPQQSPSK